MDHGVVQRWLREVVQPYNDADRVFADVDRMLIAVSSLSPKTEVYTYDDGRTQLLLLLSGTIPINYRNATYNIPMDIWVARLYPREPPIAYVKPTSDMLVRKGKNVDVSGRVGGDYLGRWEKKWESCNLLDLVHACQDIFGQEPPVYAKPKQQVTNSASSSPVASTSRGIVDPRERGPPPPPLTQTQSQISQSSPARELAPLRPPKAGSSYNAYDGSNQYVPSPSPASAAGWTVSPRHSSTLEVTPNGRSWERSPHLESRHGSWHVPPDNQSSLWSRQSFDKSPQSILLQGGPQHTHDITQATPTPAPPPLPPIQRNSFIVSPSSSSATLPAPPRPPNPELLQMHAALHHKIQSRLQHLRTNRDDIQSQLRLLINDLDRGEPAIKDEMARLEAVRDVCRATGDGLQEAVSGAKDRIEELKNRSEPDVDGMICATSIVGNQLVDLVAGDSAIGDTLFYLGQALHSEVIEVEKYLKQTRFLAREQFMRRALAQKISQGMGW